MVEVTNNVVMILSGLQGLTAVVALLVAFEMMDDPDGVALLVAFSMIVFVALSPTIVKLVIANI